MAQHEEKVHNTQSLLRVLTFFVTYRCNARCRTCFYWREMNNPTKEELTCEEIEKIARSMPAFPHLLLSGGEPLLRPDLEDIIRIFCTYNAISTVDLPSNGLLPERMAHFVRSFIIDHPEMLLTTGVSLDGLEKTHDAMRGVEGNYKKAFETIEAVNRVRYQMAADDNSVEPRLHLYTITVLTTDNIKEIPRLVEVVLTEADVDGMMFELVRGNPRDPEISPPSVSEFDKIVELSLKINHQLFLKRCSKQETSVRLAYLKEMYRLQRLVLEGNKLPLLCQAGLRLAVLEPNGDVRLCELLEPVGNIRDYDYDFPRLWNDTAASQMRQMIKTTRCSCTHCVNLGHSIDYNTLSHLRRKWNQWVSMKG